MIWNFLVIDFIIFTAAATAGFIWGAMWVDSEFEKDSIHLAAEVESLNEALDVLEEQYQELTDLYQKEVSNGNKIFDALQRSVDAREEMEKMFPKNAGRITPELQKKIKDAWRKASE